MEAEAIPDGLSEDLRAVRLKVQPTPTADLGRRAKVVVAKAAPSGAPAAVLADPEAPEAGRPGAAHSAPDVSAEIPSETSSVGFPWICRRGFLPVPIERR